MNQRFFKGLAMVAAVLFLSVSLIEQTAFARAGGGRSSGSRGSRSIPSPSRPSTPNPSRAPASPPPVQPSQPSPGGGFMRNFGAGLLGGLIGGLLFRSLGFGGDGFGGSGIGLFEIILLFGIGYLIFRAVSSRRAPVPSYPNRGGLGNDPSDRRASFPQSSQTEPEEGGDTERGLSHIRQMDPGFDESRFKETVLDSFFKIQSGWTNRDLSLIDNLLTNEMRKIFQMEIDQMFREGKINRLENIAIRKSEISEAWQESGSDFITVLIDANVLDYTTDDRSGAVVSGSKTEPVKFQEYWTFTRPVGENRWKLSAIHQTE